MDGSDNTGKYSRWHRPSILFSSSINWGKRSPHFRYDSPFGEEEKITASREREGLARANAHLVHLRRVSPFDVNLRTYRDESRVSHSQERAHTHPHFHSPTSVSLPSRHRRRLAVRRVAQTVKSCSLETSFLQSRGSKRAGLKRFIFLAIPTNRAIDRRDPDSVSPRGGDVQRPKTASRRGDPSPRARAKILDACAPLAARATSRAVRS